MAAHPLFRQLQAIALKEVIDVGEVQITFQLYLHLTEVLKLWDVQCLLCEVTRAFYICGRDSEGSHTYVPIDSCKDITITLILELQQALKTQSLILAIMDRDSSPVFYKMTNGLIQPSFPQDMQLKKQTDAQRFALQADILSHKRHLYSKALENSEGTRNNFT